MTSLERQLRIDVNDLRQSLRRSSGSGMPTGFSLVEIAVVLVIVLSLMAMAAGPLAGRIEQQRAIDTRKQLESITEALYGYAMANGRLPCPAISSSNGQESFCTTGSGACTATTTYQSHGRCTTIGSSVPGFVPAATLGLSNVDSSGFITDAWDDGASQRRLRYAVSPYLNGSTYSLTATNGVQSATMTTVVASTSHLKVCSTGASTVPTSACAAGTSSLASASPFVVFSLGKNTGTNSVDETNNQNNDSYFTQGTPNPTFDDVVYWGSLNTLFARMVQAGKLP